VEFFQHLPVYIYSQEGFKAGSGAGAIARFDAAMSLASTRGEPDSG
jgi:hypothetical protein